MLQLLPPASRVLMFIAFAPAPVAPFMHFMRTLDFPNVPFEDGLRRIHSPERFTMSLLPVPCLRLLNSTAPGEFMGANCISFNCVGPTPRVYKGVLQSTRATESRLALLARNRHMLTVWMNVSRDAAGTGHRITMRVHSTCPYADSNMAGPLFNKGPRWVTPHTQDKNLHAYRRKVLGSIA